jgi:ketosteroid isomerase-like protein
MRSIETVRNKFAAFNRHDFVAIENIYAGNAVLNSPDYHDLVGNKPIAETYRKLFDAIPDAKDDIELLEAAGNHIYVKFVMTGHWNGVGDKPISAHIMAVYTVRDGRIIDDATYYDRKKS